MTLSEPDEEGVRSIVPNPDYESSEDARYRRAIIARLRELAGVEPMLNAGAITQAIAVDWSGRAKREGEAIWLARVVDGRLEDLLNGYRREEVIQAVVGYASEQPETVVGLDFAFSFPRWYCEQEGWTRGLDVWRAMRDDAEDLLKECALPLWGRAGTKRQTMGDDYRETERATGAKSVFQIGGAGAVGTGSLRGMGHLVTLAENGFSIWPFDAGDGPRAVEIYPRLLTGAVVKGRHRERRNYLEEHYADEDQVLLERAAGSEDAFDAAVSALEMARHVTELESLPSLPEDAAERIEGQIWRPA